MPLQNRVLPSAEIVAIPARGTLTGNRGIIHRADQTLGTARWSHHAWICCVLEWQARKRPVMTGRNWTELFFLDEAVALAAGHRPCGYCRRAAYAAFVDCWTAHNCLRPKALQMDKVLHRHRIIPRTRTQLHYAAPISSLPGGAFILWQDRPHLVMDGAMYGYTPDGYATPIDRPKSGDVQVMSPKPTVDVLHAGYCPMIHPSAGL